VTLRDYLIDSLCGSQQRQQFGWCFHDDPLDDTADNRGIANKLDSIAQSVIATDQNISAQRFTAPNPLFMARTIIAG